jgi:hypothetical protein
MDSKSAPDPIVTLPRRLGLEETEALRTVRTEVLNAISQGHTKPIQAAWLKYVLAADPQVETSDPHPTNKARTGLTIAQALVYLEAGDTVRYLYQLMIADETARNSGWTDIERITDAELRNRGTLAEYRQAQGFYKESIGETDEARLKFEEATDIYVEAERVSDPEDHHVRGLLNLRLAECYGGLIGLRPDESALEVLRRFLFDSLQSAALYLQGQPEQTRATGMMDDLSHLPWWQTLEEA